MKGCCKMFLTGVVNEGHGPTLDQEIAVVDEESLDSGSGRARLEQ